MGSQVKKFITICPFKYSYDFFVGFLLAINPRKPFEFALKSLSHDHRAIWLFPTKNLQCFLWTVDPAFFRFGNCASPGLSRHNSKATKANKFLRHMGGYLHERQRRGGPKNNLLNTFEGTSPFWEREPKNVLGFNSLILAFKAKFTLPVALEHYARFIPFYKYWLGDHPF